MEEETTALLELDDKLDEDLLLDEAGTLLDTTLEADALLLAEDETAGFEVAAEDEDDSETDADTAELLDCDDETAEEATEDDADEELEALEEPVFLLAVLQAVNSIEAKSEIIISFFILILLFLAGRYIIILTN